jgi:hypothetical protein
MATKSIGATGRDYATIALWASYLDGLNTLSAPEIGECYNDGEFSGTGVLGTFTGFTASATNYYHLTTAAGQSFRDHAAKLTNPLRYDQSKGVGFNRTNTGDDVLHFAVDFFRLSNVQITGTASGNAVTTAFGIGSTATFDINNCIIERAASVRVCDLRGNDGKMRNSVVVNRNAAAGDGIRLINGVNVINCTIVRPSDLMAAGVGIDTVYGAAIVKNTAVFGYTNDTDGGVTTSTTNATNDTTPSSGFAGSLTYASQFENTLDATRDFRTKAGGGLLDAGTTDSTNAPNDIVGTARPQGSAYDIGCWELGAAGGNYSDSVTLAGLTLAGAPGLPLAVSDALAAPGNLLLAAAADLAVAVDWLDQVAVAGVRLALAGGVALAGAAAVQGRVIGFMANPNRLLGR